MSPAVPVAACVALLVAGMLAGCGSPRPPATAPERAPGITGLGAVAAGDCVTWDQSPAAGPRPPGMIVPCAAPHLAEVAATVDAGGLGGAWPGPARIAAFAGQRCPGAVARYLGHPADPEGSFGLSAIYPAAADWRAGTRTVVCDLVARTPGTGGRLAASTGQAADQGAQPLFPVGTCLAQAAASAAVVACAQAHVVEVTGEVTAPAGAALPTSNAGWLPLVGGACAAAAAQYLGGPLGLGLASSWLPVPAASWAAGRRLVPCVVGRQLDDGGWEATTGPLRG